MWGFENALELMELGERDGKTIFKLLQPLVYVCKCGDRIVVPAGFQTDLASVPRVPIIFDLWGDRAHREAVLHDYLYCKDAIPSVRRDRADHIFEEAMQSRQQPWKIFKFMYWGVKYFGDKFYKVRCVFDTLIILFPFILTSCLKREYFS